ncbi:hypothetical protein [Mesoterricola silvestris]|uniref:Uncharacterized protein n=1 Tax=Mesoterricola silvestris TaxID=2927979 RepID=A0AA48GV10_9BACT|nr:hypothetical protein [Mesoterricola silvestris]BDU72331.1 hypothetical protein METEAL_15050 [Mesoterricola silvestris]
MSQDCGGCRHFLKVRGNWGNSGLCEFQDRRTDEDCGHNCPDFKPIKFDRLASKREAQIEIATSE